MAKKNGKTELRERVKRASYALDLPVPANEEEVSTAALAMVKEIRKREALDEERRELLAQFRQRREAIDARQGELADTVENHTRKKSVHVDEYLIVETSTIEVVRRDTGEIVETRPADKDDLQENLVPKRGAGDEDLEDADA
jgi:hypothetical protein